MDVDQLRTFVAVARLRGFGRAARAVHRSQPAISRRIDLLEGELGMPLFERIRGGVMLTDAGTALLPFAETALAAMKDGSDAVRALAKGDGGSVSLALVGTLANAAFSKALTGFRRRFPKTRLDLRTANSREVGELVQRGEATLGLRYVMGAAPGLVSQTVMHERLIVVAPAGHRLANRRRIRPQELAGERWVAFPSQRSQESFVRFLDRKLQAAGLQDVDIVPIDSLTAQKRFVEAGFGIALLAASGVEEELRLGTLKELDVPALHASIPVTIVHRRNGHLGAAALGLLATIAATLKEV